MVGGKRVDLYYPSDSFVNNLDPRTKFIWMVCIGLITFFIRDVYVIILALTYILIFLFSSKAPWSRVKYIVGLSIIPSLMIGILYPLWISSGNPIIWFDWPWYHWHALTDWGIYLGFTTFLRGYAFTLCVGVTLIIMSPEEISRGLELLGLNYRFGRLFSLVFASIPSLISIHSSISQAQKARAFEPPSFRHLLSKARTATKYVYPLIYNALSFISTTAITMESRGLGAYDKRTSLDVYEMEKSDYIILAVSLCFLVIVLLLAYVYGIVLPSIGRV